MQDDEIKRVDFAKIAAFIDSEPGRRAAAAAVAGKLWREKPFTLRLPASKARENAPEGEYVYVQGIIDVFWEEADGVVLLDYKTDSVREMSELTDKYRTQLELYKEALEAGGMKVKETYIWSFSLGEVARMLN